MAGTCGATTPVVSQASTLALGAAHSIINNVQGLAATAFATAIQALNQIQSAIEVGDVNTDVTLTGITLPDLSMYLPEMPTKPDLGDIPETPPINFEYNETEYISALGTKLDEVLLEELANGSTGLTTAVESDIYSRESERDIQELSDAKAREATKWARNNAILPEACLYGRQNFLEVKYLQSKLDKSRDVRIESFKRADDNAKFVKDLSMKYENVIRDYIGKQWQRKLEAAKAVVDYGVAVYRALLDWKLALVELYKGEAQAYEAAVRGVAALAGVEVAIFDANTKYEVAKAEVKIKGIEAAIELLKSKVAAAVSAANGIATVASHLASGALSAVNASAQVGYHGQDSSSQTKSSNVTCSDNYTHEE